MGIHDLLIYADPLFWSTVPARYSALTTRKILRAPALIGWLVGRYIGLWPLAVLGVVGAIRLIRIRSWGVLVGLAALGPGMAAFLVFLALRHIWIPDRYAAPIDLALIMAGGIAAAWLLDLGLARLRSRPDGHSATSPRRVEVLAATAAAGLAIIAIWPSGFFDAGLARSVHTSLALAADVDQMAPILRGIIDRSPSTRTWPAEGSTSGMPLLLVPQPYRPRLSIDLDVPLTSLGNVTIGAGPTGRPLVGQFVAYDRHAEASTLARKPYQTTTTVVLDGVRIVPVGSDPARGWWITEILPAL
jgi:hypothetical protein